MTGPPRIAIIGSGPAGLSLAKLLQVSGIPCKVFERDNGLHDGDHQNGWVKLYPQTGQLALREAGLFEAFRRLSNSESEVLKILRPNGTPILDENNTKENKRRHHPSFDQPRIDYTRLRNLLLESLRPKTVVWGRKLVAVENSPSSPRKYDLLFEDSTEEDFDLVVGADGAHSTVRPRMTHHRPVYSGITTVQFWATEVKEWHSWLTEFVGNGSCFMFDKGRAMEARRIGDDSIQLTVSVRQAEGWLDKCGVDWSLPEEAKRKYLETFFKDCAEDLKLACLDCTDRMMRRKVYMPPPAGTRWESTPGLTLVGDAAHLMPPFADLGVDQAMNDALKLARALSSNERTPAGLARGVREYEGEMLVRGEHVARTAWEVFESHFSANGGEKFVGRVLSGGGK
ncbi:hypothetical protein H2204_012219 [Knufia peltigerae]|uniref:FAD-binding domain-containing protein n=1 Tax=Knufia peltigerae TaxID=1002370 RepID=A0AA39CSH2_9EURO|nr:hypothetical protein H2204_012219 [Knufia peltigerae]